jgi:rfaE bifunctional protein kinase chain/domain
LSTSGRKSKGSAAALAEARESVDLTHLLDIVAAFARQTICVVGDFVLDEFVSGEISRVSREAPVLILRHRRSEAYPGGAANAVNNLADLGARVLPVGVMGADEGGRTLLEYFKRKRVDVSGILRASDWVTTTKTRYLAGWTHTTEQQVLRVDREPLCTLSEPMQTQIEVKACRMARRAETV